MISSEESWPESAETEAGISEAGARERAPKKAATAFRTISEVADDLHVPQHVLRFWETRFPQVKPLKRGGGRRYYRPDDIALLRRISDLLYVQGYTIKGVQRLLIEGDGTLPEARPPGDEPDLEDLARTGRAPDFQRKAAADSASPLVPPLPAMRPEASEPRSGFDPDEATRDVHALRETLRDILAGLEAIRRQLPI